MTLKEYEGIVRIVERTLGEESGTITVRPDRKVHPTDQPLPTQTYIVSRSFAGDEFYNALKETNVVSRYSDGSLSFVGSKYRIDG
jgi:hypothetical protein